MTDRDHPFRRLDAAYVLGALAPAEREAFAAHLAGCPDCARAVAELATLPALLDGAGAAEPAAEAVPPSLLPGLASRVAGERRRRRRRLTGAAAGVAALAACLALAFAFVNDPGGNGSAGAAMTALGPYPVRASVALADAAGGTRVEMECRYDGAYGGDYVLVALDREGAAAELARWHALPGDTAELAVGTPLPRASIAALEVRTPDGTAVLRLTP
ncbi:zf-HC2 domain-containing protein [Streptomyces sp. DSM 44917]|uniref:Zf-HC2 domain-containing protein n=1 Tax=Streptomyces boetiae TaxID=3075541 RepID=A0ABU2LCJ5_9ACTN|nr:zf-HC2 domain-containing protein [Streptomyces sp. DSM 44917]MDT0309294.1 zf-HC2 domain-containing protein [Streptomyces sp. DSM 44917]